MNIATTINSLDDSPPMNSEYKIKSLPSVLLWIPTLMLSTSSRLTENTLNQQMNTASRSPLTPYTLSHATAACQCTSHTHMSRGPDCGISEHGPRFEIHFCSPGRHWLMGSDTGVVTSLSNLLRQCMDVVRLACIYAGMRRDAVSEAARWQVTTQSYSCPMSQFHSKYLQVPA